MSTVEHSCSTYRHQLITLHSSAASVGLIPAVTQVGIGLGVLLILPLGDLIDGRKLIVGLMCLHTAALAFVAASVSTSMLIGTSFIMGVTTVTPYLLPAFAARLASPAQRGEVTGLLARGVFAGILLARTASGYVGYYTSWRAIYLIAMVAMLVCATLFLRKMSPSPAPHRSSYLGLIMSLERVLSEHAILRRAALTQGLLFGGFNAFWTTLAFYLASPSFHVPSYVAGLFGVIGLAGALAAPVFGRLADKRGPQFAVRLGTIITLCSWVVFAALGHTLTGLVVGVLMLDLGTTASHVSNQASIYQLGDDIRSRVTTVYILGLFIGASVLTVVASLAWTHAGWPAVCFVGGISALAGVLAYLPAPKAIRHSWSFATAISKREIG